MTKHIRDNINRYNSDNYIDRTNNIINILIITSWTGSHGTTAAF